MSYQIQRICRGFRLWGNRSFQLFQPRADLLFSVEEVWGVEIPVEGVFRAPRFGSWELVIKNEEGKVLASSCNDIEEGVASLRLQPEDKLSRVFRFSGRMKLASQNRIGLSSWWGFREFCRISVSPLAHALEGRKGWLFLDNDTNNSVQQFQGNLLLDFDHLAQWDHYLAEFDKIPQRTKVRQVEFLATPSKEDVYPQFHPFPSAEVRPLLQLRSIGKKYQSYLDAYSFMKKSSERVFRKTDTHWNPTGARLAALKIAHAFGIGQPHSFFDQDEYQENPEIGDLGVRSFPPRWAKEKRLKNFRYAEALLFDNQVENFGRILITRWKKAYTDQSLLIFGGSSSYFLLDYLSRLFREVYLIHSAGNIDSALLDLLAPDFLLAQTTGRFIFRVPSLDYCFGEVLRKKWQESFPSVKRVAEFHSLCLLPQGVDDTVVQKVVRYHGQWLGF